MNETKIINCINCGSPVTTEICAYCGKKTGIESNDAYTNYPVIEAEKLVSKHNYAVLIFFAVLFGLPGFGFLLPYIVTQGAVFLPLVFAWIFFELLALIFTIFIIKTILNDKDIKNNSKEIEAVVYGYIENNSYIINNFPALKIKLLIHTEEGYKFLMYQLHNFEKPYPINSKITLIKYKDKYQIKDEEVIEGFLGGLL